MRTVVLLLALIPVGVVLAWVGRAMRRRAYRNIVGW